MLFRSGSSSASWARRSASITSAPSPRNRPATVLLPLATPPTSPTTGNGRTVRGAWTAVRAAADDVEPTCDANGGKRSGKRVEAFGRERSGVDARNVSPGGGPVKRIHGAPRPDSSQEGLFRRRPHRYSGSDLRADSGRRLKTRGPACRYTFGFGGAASGPRRRNLHASR